VSRQFCHWEKKFKCGKKRSKVAKRKLVTNVSKNSSLERGCDLLCSEVVKEDFCLVGALVVIL
jgi:hypothetical protein